MARRRKSVFLGSQKGPVSFAVRPGFDTSAIVVSIGADLGLTGVERHDPP